MRTNAPAVNQLELEPLMELTARVGSDPLLTQASTGNSSLKADGVLWIKASGKWMADAKDQDILIPLDLAELMSRCLQQNVDPSVRFPGASLETAMHAVLPHRVVLHVHCVNTIAWAVRRDAPAALTRPLDGLRWQWVPYIASGLPLAREIEKALATQPDTDVFALGNHGLVVGGEDVKAVEDLLCDVKQRLAIYPRHAHPADYTALSEISEDSPWELPDDDEVHALGTDPISQTILSGGLLYPCQAIFTSTTTAELFRSIPCPYPEDRWQSEYETRPFLMIEGRGVIFSRSMAAAERAMLSGLAQVVQRIPASVQLRYLTDSEIASSSDAIARSYRDLANERR